MLAPPPPLTVVEVEGVTTGVLEVELALVVRTELVVLVVLLMLVLLVEVLVEDVVAAVLVTTAPGKHCEYHSFWATQALPLAQHVAPVHPLPPHCALTENGRVS